MIIVYNIIIWGGEKLAKSKKFVQNNNTNAICYYRYSSSAQRDCSIEQQQEAAHKYCKAHNYHIIKEYADRAISGTRDDRPEFQLMLKEITKLKPAYLILWKTDRLSRDRVTAVVSKEYIRQAGTMIEYVAESMPENEADRMLVEGMDELLAAHFIMKHTENVTRGLNFNAGNALYNGRKILGYKGAQNQRYEIDNDTAIIVQKIFKDYADGKALQVIANELNNVGYKTVRGNEFTVKSLLHTLHNRSYIGEYKYGDIVVADGFPRLVSDETFDKVQEMLERNKHGGRGAAKRLKNSLEEIDFWLSGKLVCGECGANVSGTSGTSSHSKKMYYYYTCNERKKHKCSLKNMRKDDIERIVANVLEECINNSTLRLLIADKVYDYYMREYASDENYEKSLVNNIKDINKKLRNIMKAIEAGIFNETTQARMQELQEQKQLLEDELDVERNRKKYALKKEHVVRYLESFAGSIKEPSMRDKVLNYLVESIYVYNDKIVINFYYSDDKRIIDLKQFNEHLDNLDNIMNELDEVKERELSEDGRKALESIVNF